MRRSHVERSAAIRGITMRRFDAYVSEQSQPIRIKAVILVDMPADTGIRRPICDKVAGEI